MKIEKIYCSGSQQPNNIYVGGQFNEEELTHIYIKDHLAPKLIAKGYQVMVSDPKNDMYGNIDEANIWMGASGLYLAHHTNANAVPGSHDGTLVLDYGSNRSKILAKCLYNEMAPVTPSTDEGIRTNPGLAELRRPVSTAALIEMFYHDNLADVKWGITHLDQLAEAEVRGIEEAVRQLAA